MSRLSIFTFIDAFGWQIMSGRSFLPELLTERQPLQTVLGYSSTCVPTILTGRLPREHGHLSFFRYAPEQSPFGLCRLLSFLPTALASRGRVRRMMSRLLQHLYGFTGYFQIYNVPFRYLPYFDYTEKKDIYQPAGINGGSPTIFDALRERKVPFHLADWRRREADNVREAAAAIDGGEIQVAYLYFASMDALLHAEGTGSPHLGEKLRFYEDSLRYLMSRAHRRYEEVRLFVFSDHGMADVRQHLDLMGRIGRLGLEYGREYVAMYDSTMARFWFHTDRARTRIEAALRDEPRGRILADSELARYGCDFPDRRYGELFFLLSPGVLICPSFMGQKPVAGMHGYAPEDLDSAASFASNVKLEQPPETLLDLYSLMLQEATDDRHRLALP
ncbi:MAG: alkaline phosphatase family protein [Candidatus Xenobia bacterium]